MRLLKHLPNVLTLLNLACGFIAIVLAFNINTLIYAPYFIFIAAGFDFADGLAARVLNAYSELGKQLDSLSDMVSFGVTPGILSYQLLQFSTAQQSAQFFILSLIIASLIPIFSAYRLGKFNIDQRQHSSFLGLPTPASAIFIASLVLVVLYYPATSVTRVVLNFYILSFLLLSDAVLMVVDMPMFSFKIKNLRLADNAVQYGFLLSCLLLLILFNFKALPFLVPLYVALSFVIFAIQRFRVQ
ncbi:MAG: CDP-alcohol phosphatidyltransferase family protein [Bacteroidales bacterium]